MNAWALAWHAPNAASEPAYCTLVEAAPLLHLHVLVWRQTHAVLNSVLCAGLWALCAATSWWPMPWAPSQCCWCAAHDAADTVPAHNCTMPHGSAVLVTAAEPALTCCALSLHIS